MRRYQRFVFGIDGLGQQLQITTRTPARSFQLDPLGGAFGGLTASRAASSASIRTTEVMAEAAAGWRALALPVSQLFSSVPASDRRQIWVDLLGGARYWYWRTEVRLSIPPVTIQATNPPPLPDGLRGRIAERILSRLDLPRSIQVGGSNAVLEDTVSWTDALIGFRIGGDVAETVSLQLRADVGGFGFGDSSKFSWQVMPGVQWRFAENWLAALNWRVIGFEHARVDNVIFYGAQVGIETRQRGLELDRTSSHRFLANQLRVLMPAAAYVLLQKPRRQAEGTRCEAAHVTTLRERLPKLAAWFEVSVRRVVVHLARSFAWRPCWLRLAAQLGAAPG